MDIFSIPTAAAKKIIESRRQTFSPELEWRDELVFFSINIEVVGIFVGQKIYPCRSSTVLLTVYPELMCTIQLHIELSDDIVGAKSAIQLVKYLRETTLGLGSHDDLVRCQLKNSIVDYPNLDSLFDYIEKRFMAVYRLPQNYSPVSFIYPCFYVGVVPGCKTASDIIYMYPREISGVLNLWSLNYDLQSASEMESRLSRNFHPLVYGVTYISSNALVEFHPENIREIALREKRELRFHHLQELYFGAAITEIAVAQYFALRVCDEYLNRSFAEAKISFVYVLNPLLCLVRALRVLRFEKHITLLLSSIRSLALTRKSYTREALIFLHVQFDTQALQDRVSGKITGINRILTSMFQSIIATTSLILAVAAIALTIIQLTDTKTSKESLGKRTLIDIQE